MSWLTGRVETSKLLGTLTGFTVFKSLPILFQFKKWQDPPVRVLHKWQPSGGKSG